MSTITTTTGTRPTTGPQRVMAELARLQRDPHTMARSVGAALSAAVLEGLTEDERRWSADIEELRMTLEESAEEIDVALSNNRGLAKPAELGDICRRRSKKRQWGSFLLTLARTLDVERCVELGTCLGISSAYLAAGMRLGRGGRLITLEGAPALAERSAENLASLGLHNVDVVAGLFAATLEEVLRGGGPVGLSFIDGHHHEEPTLGYFDQMSGHLTDPSVVVFDDIRWSEGMERAWDTILADRRVRVAVDLTSVGVCVVGRESTTPARVYRFPTITAMQPSMARLRTDDTVSVRGIDGAPARLGWTSGPGGRPGWLNVADTPGPRIDIAIDVRHGLPVDDEQLDCIVSMYTLPTIPLMDVPEVLAELRRTLKPGGILRLGVPDFESSLTAFNRGDRNAFVVSDRDAETLSGKFITQSLWYGLGASVFTWEYLEELLLRAGFSGVERCAFGQTTAPFPGIVELDEHRQGLFVEAVR